MKIKQLFKKRDRLQSELDKTTKEIEKRKLIGYRVIYRGDMYVDGKYADFLFTKECDKRETKADAEAALHRAENGGHIVDLFPWNRQPPKRIS